MKPIREHLAEAAHLLAAVADGPLGDRVDEAARRIAAALSARLPLLVCGNGGSASDADHIAGELVGRFLKERPALKCVCLASGTAALTAWANDYSYETIFARQVEAYGEPGGVLLGLSTSGNSANVVAAFAAARRLGMATVAMTGEGGGRLRELSDVLIDVPSRRTPDIQQAHVVLYHWLCEAVEERCAAAG